MVYRRPTWRFVVSYLVLARKWRPQGFEAITGQEHVTRTLTNAIDQDRVHHAFLFCGARGVGKTSAARVFARALNCRRASGPTAEPCGECEACVEIAAGTSLDVFEIDGASNRGINEIRELRDGVAYAPQRDRFKIYIIDEVHMLTTEAFNALLKTLEEPPRHVKFIFATTEPHKIPVTILSRCQRFDFKRIPRATMVARLGEILAAEDVRIDEAGLRVVARESEGSMRDALSLLDRIISFCGKEATYEQVAEVLGVADRGWLAGLVQAALDGEVSEALGVVEGAFEFGLDLRQFATDLVHYLRDVIVLKVAGEKGGLTDLSAEETRALVAIGQNRNVEDLQRLANIAIKTAERLAHANFPRLELEMAVIRMCSLRPLQPIGELVRRLEAIERHLASGAPLPDPPPFGGKDERGARVDPARFTATRPTPTPAAPAP
ncbi:MAG: DNA polymerase III subunit gamma/tau, partial [Deltaproteobacteria bacterium]